MGTDTVKKLLETCGEDNSLDKEAARLFLMELFEEMKIKVTPSEIDHSLSMCSQGNQFSIEEFCSILQLIVPRGKAPRFA